MTPSQTTLRGGGEEMERERKREGRGDKGEREREVGKSNFSQLLVS